MGNIDKDFLEAIKEALKAYVGLEGKRAERSNVKLKPLHMKIKNDLESRLKSEIGSFKELSLVSLDINPERDMEDSIEGRYYTKKVDISIRLGGKSIGAIGVKFVISNYMQNANNYFENMLGETANIRTANIPYFQVFIMFDKMPYFESKGKFRRWEHIDEKTHLKKYIKLSEDNIDLYYHTPILTLLTILSNPLSDNEVENREGYKDLLRRKLNDPSFEIKYSDKFNQNIFKENVILNNYDLFLSKVVCYLKFRYAQ